MQDYINVIGGGLAGCEAAYQIAKRGIKCRLYEMKPQKFSPAHKVYSPLIMHMNKHIQIVPRWITHSDRWYIYVQDGDDKDYWEVSKEYYDSVEIGDHVERTIK